MTERFGVGEAVLELGGRVEGPAVPPPIRGRDDVVGGASAHAPEAIAPPREGFPLLARPAPEATATDPKAWAAVARRLLDERLLEAGAILLRGLPLPTVQHFSEFQRALDYEPLRYQGFATREEVAPGVTTSNVAGPGNTIMLHNDMSHDPEMPAHLFLYCATPAPPGAGGETPIARSVDWNDALGPELCARFEERGICRITTSPDRRRGPSRRRPWQVRYQTEDPAEAEARCIAQGDRVVWTADGSLKTHRVMDAFIEHRGRRLWCATPQNHYPVSALELHYGDGAPIEPEVLDRLRGVQWAIAVAFAWQQGDVLCLDNLGCQHGRLPYRQAGEREVYVSIATPVPGTCRTPEAARRTG